MKPKTTGGKTQPCPTQHDCDLLDRTIDLLLLYKEYESLEGLQQTVQGTLDRLRTIAGRWAALREPEAQSPKT